MKEVTYEIYNDDKSFFFEKHGFDFNVTTSPMEAGGTYYKTYLFEDGSVWYERMSHYVTNENVTVHNVQLEVKIELQRIDYWSSDISRERTYFERW
jgi:hypothetical protein